MGRRRILLITAIALASAGCAGPAASSPAPSAPSSAATTSSAAAGASPALVVGGDRPVTVHVPASYDPNKPAPLLILLHGYTGSGAGIEQYFHVADAAERLGYVYAAPDGTVDAEGHPFWNATDACCNFHGSTVDDVAYLSSVISKIQGKLAIDPKRIAVAGHSNGGFMSYRMACERADLVSAVVSLAGETFADPADCRPSAPVSVAQVQGTADDVILYAGGGPLTDASKAYPGAEATAGTWASYDGCDTAASTLDEKLDLDAGVATGSDQADTTVQQWSGCDAGAAVELWTILRADHGPALTPAFTDAFMQFLADHPKP